MTNQKKLKNDNQPNSSKKNSVEISKLKFLASFASWQLSGFAWRSDRALPLLTRPLSSDVMRRCRWISCSCFVFLWSHVTAIRSALLWKFAAVERPELILATFQFPLRTLFEWRMSLSMVSAQLINWKFTMFMLL